MADTPGEQVAPPEPARFELNPLSPLSSRDETLVMPDQVGVDRQWLAQSPAERNRRSALGKISGLLF